MLKVQLSKKRLLVMASLVALLAMLTPPAETMPEKLFVLKAIGLKKILFGKLLLDKLDLLKNKDNIKLNLDGYWYINEKKDHGGGYGGYGPPPPYY